MDKPTQETIIKDVTTNYKPIKVNSFESIESFTLVMKYKYQAESVAQAINTRFGQWVYASVHAEWKTPHVSVGYRSKELTKCESCGWLDGLHSNYCKRIK